MLEVIIDDEAITTSGAQSVLQAAVDELRRRYGTIDDNLHLGLEELSPPTGVFLVARDHGHLTGGVGLRRIAEPELGLAEVKRLWVRPDLRRQGVAAQLMDELERRARAMNYRQLYLETGPAQPEAIAFYPKHGWTQVDQFPTGVYTHEGAHRFTKIL
jgi:GNAT superfamily N-acetyltransferase